MAHELRGSDRVDEGVRRLAMERLERSLERLHARDREVVHDVRKECKQVRALLRLVRDELGDELYRRENARLRDLARPLSELRDAQALVEALDGLVKHFARELRPRAFAGLRRPLRDQLRAHEHASPRALRNAAVELKRALERVPRWPIAHRGWKALERGLLRTYAQGRRAMDAALDTRSDEDLHEWRKQAKYLRAEIDVVEKMWPDALEGMSHALHELSDLLGGDHDLAVLAQRVTNGHAGALRDDERAALLGLLYRRRDELQRQALKLGQKLYAEPPRLFIGTLHEHWRAWHRA